MRRIICGRPVDLHWYNFLSLIAVPIILTLTFVFQNAHDIIYEPLMCGICAMIIFINFPAVVIFLHSRPIYYDDLIIKNYEGEGYIYDDNFRKKYQVIFQWFATITSSFMIGLTVELWFYRSKMFPQSSGTGAKAVSSFVVMGVIGGMLKLYYGATMILGRIILFALKYFKQKEQERMRLEVERRTVVELSGVGVTIGTDLDEASLIPRAASYNNLRSSETTIHGFKPTLMTDLFNE